LVDYNVLFPVIGQSQPFHTEREKFSMFPAQEGKTVRCKYCGTHEIVKYGSYKGIPRYFCKSCGRKFKDDDQVFHMSIPAAYIECVLNLYYSGMHINDIRNSLQQNFSYYPSATLIHFWIDKYTEKAEQMTHNGQPQVGDTWVAGERPIRLNGKRGWLYEIIDDETFFLLASLIVPTRTTDLAKKLIQRASEVARKKPKIVMVYIPFSAFNSMEKGADYLSQQVPRETFADRYRIGILSDANMSRIRNLNSLRTITTAERFFKGLSIHYNYFESNEKLKGQTPALAAKINYPFHSWKDLIAQLPEPGKRQARGST
jgi:transposase-like protein